MATRLSTTHFGRCRAKGLYVTVKRNKLAMPTCSSKSSGDRTPKGVRPRSVVSTTPCEILNFLARLGEEPESDDGSTVYEEAPSKGSDYRSRTTDARCRLHREGILRRPIASPGRWTPEQRRYPPGSVLFGYSEITQNTTADRNCWRLWRWRRSSSAHSRQTASLTSSLRLLHVLRRSGDRRDVPIDFRYLDTLRVAGDPEVQGVRVRPQTRPPRLTALYNRRSNGGRIRLIPLSTWNKIKTRTPGDAMTLLWVISLDRVLDVLHQPKRGQVII